MAKKKSIWDDGPSKYGTYDGPRGNTAQWQTGFGAAWSGSDTVKTLLGNTAYAILGLQPGASESEVRSAYRNLARIHHPDKGGNVTNFHKIKSAYERIMGRIPTEQPLFDPATPSTPPKKKKRKVEVDDDCESDLDIPDISIVTIIPQLLTPIDENELEFYLTNDEYGAQEKKDGKHLTLQIIKDKFFVRNKKGDLSTCEPELERALRSVGHNVLIDGEQIGKKFWVWDILELDLQNLRTLSYKTRYEILSKFRFDTDKTIQVLPLITGETEKRALYAALKAAGKEGIVFKKLNAVFSPGKGMDQFKFKFYSEASFIVALGRQGKASIGLNLFNPSHALEFMGYCSCSLHPLPVPGTIVEVKYLYAYKGGCIYQPAFKEIRDDVNANECVMSQLKYKSEDDE